MRDYKHVRVPKSSRITRNRVVTKRVEISPEGRKRGKGLSEAAGTVLALVVTVALGYGAWEGYRWLSGSGMFQVAGVDVKGVRAVSDDEVRALAGMFTGQNIFRVDLDAATRQALANPWVRDVRIERSLPNRISMKITERIPRAVLLTANGRFLIDREAVVIVPAGPGSVAELPAVSVHGHRAEPRGAVTGDGVHEALELLDQLAARGGWDPAAVTVKADSAETISILYADREFRIGSGNYGEKLRRLGEIVADMNQRHLAYTYVELRPERQAAAMVKNDRVQGPGSRGQGRQQKKRT
jgi:cell division septal protein FtsQ